MWASNYGASGGGGSYDSSCHSSGGAGGGAAVASGQQWPPNAALNGAGWCPDAYAAWFYQAHSQAAAAAQGAATIRDKASQRGSSDRPVLAAPVVRGIDKAAMSYSTTSKLRNQPMRNKALPKPIGLSFSELENRLNSSWEDLVEKEGSKVLQPPSELAMPMPSRLVGIQVAAELVNSPPSIPPPPPAPPTPQDSTASIFCPICADPGGTCPFHSGTCWASTFGETSASQTVCEAPPPSHIAHAMAELCLDPEDASTEASSGDFYGVSDDWSDLGEVNSVLQDQSGDGGAWWSASRRESPSESHQELRSPGYAASMAAVAWPAVATVSPTSRSQREGARAEASQINVEHLNQILAMGFPEADARSALEHIGQRGLDAVVAFLLDGVSA